MEITRAEARVCSTLAGKCHGMPYVKWWRMPPKALDAFEKIGWGDPEIFTPRNFGTVDAQEVATAAAFCIALHKRP